MVTKIDNETKKLLKQRAYDASLKAMCPYSNYHVGAALLLEDGRIISGFNIESPAFTPTICAERSTLFSALTQYDYKKGTAKAIAIYASDKKPASPCGVCRQVMSDLLEKDTPVLLFGENGVENSSTVGELLPLSFSEDSLN